MGRIYCLFLFCVLSIYGFSFEDALKVAECLKLCANESCANMCNHRNPTFTPTGFPQLTENANANISLHCTGMYAMMIEHSMGTYIAELGLSNGTWSKVRVITGALSLFSNLTAGIFYRYRFYKLTDHGISLPEVSNWFATYKETYVPQKVEHITMKELHIDDGNICELWAQINFEPAKDRSCNYHVGFWTGQHNLINYGINEYKTPGFTFDVKHLEFNRSNLIFISSTNEYGAPMSNRTLFTFITPSCLELHNNLSICAPEQVIGLKVKKIDKHGFLYNVLLNWDKPDQEPDNYTIEITTYQGKREIIVSGNATEVSVKNIELGPEYIVSIMAESIGGTSAPSSILESINKSADEYLTYREIIIIVIPTIIIMVAVLALGIWCMFRKRHKNKYNNMQYSHFEAFSQGIVTQTAKDSLKQDYTSESQNILISQEKFELSPERLKIRNVLGSGAYGIVRLGLLQSDHNEDIEVAVKMLKDTPTTEDIKSFHQEIVVMKSAGQHPNIVSLIGYCTLYNKPLLVVEYCSKGDLQTYLRTIWEGMINVIMDHKASFKGNESVTQTCLQTFGKNEMHYENSRTIANCLYDIQEDIIQSTESVSATDLLNFARQVATGMEFLSSNRIVHRDLAARNVLLCADRIVKISDFGLSRDVYQENVYRKQSSGKLPVKWMAIEALTHQVYTTYSDVWSYGIFLWEIVTLGGVPYPSIPMNKILSLLKSGYRMKKPPSCSAELYNIMYSCWNARPQSRPTFTELKESLDNLICTDSENTYLNLTDVLKESEDKYNLLLKK